VSNVNPYESPSHRTNSPMAQTFPLRATGVLRPDDAISALKAIGKWRAWLGSLIVATIIIVVGIVLALNQPAPNDWVWPAIFCGVMAVFALLLPLQVRHRFANTWNARPENQAPVTWTFSDDGLLVETTRSKHLHFWEAFDSITVTRDQLILAQNGGVMFNFIPRRFFESDDEWTAVCQLVAAKVRMRQTGASPPKSND